MRLVWQDRKLTHRTDRKASLLLLLAVRPAFEKCFNGGLRRWSQLRAVEASASVTGALWHVKGGSDVLGDIRVRGQLHQEKLTTYLVGENKRFVFTPHQVAVETEARQLLENREDLRSSFRGQQLHSRWDDFPWPISAATRFGPTLRSLSLDVSRFRQAPV